jgi:DNA-binding response OmpR family regulator
MRANVFTPPSSTVLEPEGRAFAEVASLNMRSTYCKRIREMGSATAVLYVSGYPIASLADEGLEPNADFLAKPFTPSQLKQKVAAVLAARGDPDRSGRD